jgi:ElaB/YqjD/DUF883 family membrane-anchored ribosome-binding protein
METEDAKDAARELGGSAQETIGEWAGQAQRAYGSAVEEASEYVRTQPVTALLIAGGVGFLLGALLVRR